MVWRGGAALGGARSFLGEAKLGVVGCWVAKLCTVRWGEALLWFGDVLLGVGGVAWGTVLSGMALCGMVWSREALHSIVELGPVRHCEAWSFLARRSPVLYCLERFCGPEFGHVRFYLVGRGGEKVMFCTVGWYPARHRIVRSGTVVSCLALLCAARCASPQILVR